MREKCWMVKGLGPSNYIHPTRQAAIEEAKRLARENPDQEFFVFESITGFVRREVEEIEVDDIPF